MLIGECRECDVLPQRWAVRPRYPAAVAGGADEHVFVEHATA